MFVMCKWPEFIIELALPALKMLADTHRAKSNIATIYYNREAAGITNKKFKNSFYKSRIHLDFSYSITLL